MSSNKFTLRGLASIFRLGKRGPQIKANGSLIEMRDAGDTAYVQLRVADPVSPDDVVNQRSGDAKYVIRLSPQVGARLLQSSGISGDLAESGIEITVDNDLSGIRNLHITGDLIIDGTTTTINSTVLNVEDKNITLATGATTDLAADGGGFTLKGATDKLFRWIQASAAWVSSEHIEVEAGKEFRVNGNEYLTTKNTDDLSEGSSNLYYTDARAQAANSAALSDKQDTSEKGQPNGYASLDGDGLVPASQLPASLSSGAISVADIIPKYGKLGDPSSANPWLSIWEDHILSVSADAVNPGFPDLVPYLRSKLFEIEDTATSDFLFTYAAAKQTGGATETAYRYIELGNTADNVKLINSLWQALEYHAYDYSTSDIDSSLFPSIGWFDWSGMTDSDPLGIYATSKLSITFTNNVVLPLESTLIIEPGTYYIVKIDVASRHIYFETKESDLASITGWAAGSDLGYGQAVADYIQFHLHRTSSVSDPAGSQAIWRQAPDSALFTPGDGIAGLSRLDNSQGHRHEVINGSSVPRLDYSGPYGLSGSNVGIYTLVAGDPVTDTVNGTPRTGPRTQPRNLPVYHYLFTGLVEDPTP